MRVDLHQHFWGEGLVAGLCRRARPPFGRLEGTTLVLDIAGETPSSIDLAGERRAARVALLERDGLDRAVVAISSPIGIEALPRAQAEPLIDAHLDDVLGLGARFAAWGPIALEEIVPGDVDAVLARGAIGVSLPAGALARPALVDALGGVLERLEAVDAPLFIHPGPGLATRQAETVPGDPPWWPALTGYVSQMQAAWLALAVVGRAAHPRLRVLHAMAAGLAPLLHERLAARGGPPRAQADPLTFYEISSFGPSALGALAVVTGEESLLYGSDRPVVEPPPAPPGLAERGARLLAGRDAPSATMR